MNILRDQALADGVVILGAGQAGGRAAETLRREGFSGSITLIGDEIHRPYERPSLSKEMLLDTANETITWLHAPDYYAEQDIALRLGVSALSIDRAHRRIALSDQSDIGYGILLLATGARVRRLEVPGSDEGCHVIRSIEDSRRLRSQLVAGCRLVVIGAGFIGLEVAAAAIARGCEVTVIEATTAPLGRVAPPPLQAYYRQLHTGHGVSFRFDTQVRAILGGEGARFVQTDTGEDIPADIVVVGIGAIPNAELAAGAGLTCDHGVLVDAFGATDDPRIFAAGDVARHDNPLLKRHILLESWQNAQDQAIAIARNIARAEAPEPYVALPWFWSDQYGVNLQIYGVQEEGGHLVTRGDPAARSWMIAQFKDERIMFAAGINAGRDLRPIRELMKLRARVAPADFANESITMPDLLRRAREAREAA